jgi:DNA-binding transcriptional MerR regulator
MSGRQLPIGEFARRSRLPVSTLRYYHELGLLLPARVDETSGYRYYDASQLEGAVLVGELRRLGMSPSEIARITSGSLSLAAGLTAHRRRLVDDVDDLTARVELIDALLTSAADRSSHEVEVQSRPAKEVPGLRGWVESESVATRIRRLAATLRGQIRAEGLADPSWYGAMFSLDLDADPIELAVFAGGTESPVGSVSTVDLPGGDHAVTNHQGRRNLTAAYETVLDWTVEQGREPNGVLIEEYRSGGLTTVAIDLKPIS